MFVCVFKTFAPAKVLLFSHICKKNKFFFKNNSVFYRNYPFPHTHYDRFDSPLFFPRHAMPVLPLLPITIQRFCAINSLYCIKKYIFCAINLYISEKSCTFAAEKLQRVSYMDFKILNFTIFCVNNVASYLNKSAKDVYHAMQNAGMIDGYIVPCYDVLHSFSKEYIVDDLVSLMRQKGVQL